MYNILIIEDELLIAEMAKGMLLELKYHVAGIAKNYNEGIKLLNQYRNQLDLVILDINLSEEKTGIELAALIKNHYNLPFIYLTSYRDPEMIRKAVATRPEGYLYKPFTKLDFFVIIEMIKARDQSTNKSIRIKEKGLLIPIDSKDILCLISDSNYLTVYTSDRKFILRRSIDSFLEELDDPNFIRIHRSYAVNILNIEAIRNTHVIVNGREYPISRAHKDKVIELFLARGE